MPTERCGNCRFLEPTDTVCRRYPPTIAANDGTVGCDGLGCGEWQAKQRTEQDDEAISGNMPRW